MSLVEFYSRPGVTVSYELFPPKTRWGERALMQNVAQLMSLSPSFITCTYGAGGSSQQKTLDILQQVRQHFSVPVASHLTLVGRSVDQLRDYLRQASDIGVNYVVALRGDPPRGSNQFAVTSGGLRYANELVQMIRDEFPQFGIAVAGYPEVHQEAPSAEVDLGNLKRKVDAGADVVITQLFFHNQDFYRFRDRCWSAGIEVPIVPGIMPITDFKQIKKITSLCGSKLPGPLLDQLSVDDDPTRQFQVGVDHAIGQVMDLIDQEIPGIHFYVLNRSEAISALMQTAEIASRLNVPLTD